MNLNPVPDTCPVVIIGAGPAGSSAANHLAKNGIETVLLERTDFPRNQVGESLIPHFWKFTDLLGVSDKIKAEGFLAKSGGITVWDGLIHQIRFSDFGYIQPGLHVERDRFDQILLHHAQSCGAQVYQPIVVRQVDFSNADQPVVHITDKRGGTLTTAFIRCQYVIDASGPTALLANQLDMRQSISSKLKFLSLWGYFNDSRYVGVDRCSHAADELSKVAPVTFVMSHEDGWLWHIILRNKTSVGLIIHTNRLKGLRRTEREAYFKRVCTQTPYLNELLAPASFIEGSLQYRPDYSYYSKQMCGDNFYCIGDAATFVDPIYSHGVQNAFYNASVVAIAVEASLKDKKRRARYSRLCESRMQQFYGFSRALSLGDFGGDGVNHTLVKNLMRSMPHTELALMMAAAEITNRSQNFRQLADDAGVLTSLNQKGVVSHADRLDRLIL